MKLPKEILIYVADYDKDGTPLFVAVRHLNEIPEDIHGQKVGNYVLNQEATFKVKRELK